MKIYGQHDEATLKQLERCVAAEDGAPGVLCADAPRASVLTGRGRASDDRGTGPRVSR